MLSTLVSEGAGAKWFTGDEVYGADTELQTTIRDLGLGYVLGIASNRTVTTVGTHRVDAVGKSLPAAHGNATVPGPAPRANAGTPGF